MTASGTAEAEPKPQGNIAEPITSQPTRGAAWLIAILLHALAIAALVIGLPLLPHHPPIKTKPPIAITMLAELPEDTAPSVTDATPQAQSDAASADASAAQAVAAQAATTEAKLETQAADNPGKAPADDEPYFNPFSTTLEVTENSSAPPTPPEAADGGQVDMVQDETSSPAGGAGPVQAPGGPGEDGRRPGGADAPGSQPGRPDGDPLLHPQYLSIHLRGYVPVTFTDQLHLFLVRLIQCGVVPVVAKDPGLSVEADVDFTPVGGVAAVRLTNEGQFTEPAYQKAAQALTGALSTPSCAYIQLPVQFYPVWRNVHLSFYQHVPGQ